MLRQTRTWCRGEDLTVRLGRAGVPASTRCSFDHVGLPIAISLRETLSVFVFCSGSTGPRRTHRRKARNLPFVIFHFVENTVGIHVLLRKAMNWCRGEDLTVRLGRAGVPASTRCSFDHVGLPIAISLRETLSVFVFCSGSTGPRRTHRRKARNLPFVIFHFVENTVGIHVLLRKAMNWCRGEDLNLHGVAPTST